MDFERFATLQAVAPSVDVFNGGFTTPGFNIANYDRLIFIFNYAKILTTGQGKLLMKAADNAALDNPVNIPFKYITKNAEVESAIADAVAANGVSTTPNTSQLIIMEVRQAQCPDDKPFVHIVGSELVDDPVKGSMIVLAFHPQVAPKPSLLT